jgi:hypothetical protein
MASPRSQHGSWERPFVGSADLSSNLGYSVSHINEGLRNPVSLRNRVSEAHSIQLRTAISIFMRLFYYAAVPMVCQVLFRISPSHRHQDSPTGFLFALLSKS